MGKHKGKYDTGNRINQLPESKRLNEEDLVTDNSKEKVPSAYAEVIKMTTDVARGEKAELEKIAKKEEKHRRCLSKIKIIWAFISCLISAADVVVIIVLSYLHFIHEHDIIAWLMLLPILLNFIGIFTFLSKLVSHKISRNFEIIKMQMEKKMDMILLGISCEVTRRGKNWRNLQASVRHPL
jgi:hypothetical protein